MRSDIMFKNVQRLEICACDTNMTGFIHFFSPTLLVDENEYLTLGD